MVARPFIQFDLQNKICSYVRLVRFRLEDFENNLFTVEASVACQVG